MAFSRSPRWHIGVVECHGLGASCWSRVACITVPTSMRDNPYHFDFGPLKSGVLNISKVYGAFLAENSQYCLNIHKHPTPVSLALTGDLPKSGTLDWSGVKLPDGTCTDLQEATEYGACGIALLVALRLTGMTFVERSAKGTGIDYWLGNERSPEGIFQSAARLEVSGILNGDDAKITARVNAKLHQTQPSDPSGLPAYVAVVEFRRPEARFVRKIKR
jgi:hypothetical protein